MKRFFAAVLAVATCLVMSVSAFAGYNPVEVIDLGDGITVEITTQVNAYDRASTRQASKTARAKNGSVVIGEFTLYGEFSYNGSTAKAPNSDWEAEGYSGWDYKSASSSYSGAKVSGTCTFYDGSLSKNLTLSMTCSKDGTIS